jgi:site-specific recombinase XerD
MANQIRVVLRGGNYCVVDSRNREIEVIGKFLAVLSARGLSPHTLRSYAYDLVNFYRWLSSVKRELVLIEYCDLVNYISYQKIDNASPKTINHRLVVSELLFEFAVGREICGKRQVNLPAQNYKGIGKDRYLGINKLRTRRNSKLRVKQPRKLMQPLDRKQVRLFLQNLRRYRDIGIVQLMLLCGLRSQEVLNIRYSDISFDQKHLIVNGKGNKQRAIPLPDVIIESLKKYTYLEREKGSTQEKLFLILQGPNKGKPMTSAGLRSIFRRRRLISGLNNANAHRMRHTFGVEMARVGVRLPTLQKLMGHADPATTLQYINLSMVDIANEYKIASSEIEKRYFHSKKRDNK